MANMTFMNAAGATKYRKSSGAGTDIDPFISQFLETNSAAIKTAVEAIQTAVEILDNAIAGTEVQADIVAALPAGANAIGKLAANSGVDIGDVDVTSVVPGIAATSLGKAEDAAHTSGDVGVMTLAVRQDVAAVLSGTDGDYTPLIVDATGALYVAIGSIAAGTNAIGKLAANSGVDIGDVDVLSIAAGDNNIGNVDIVTLPAANLGQRAMAASVSSVPASDITDATYIGDIKFGEALPAGTNNIGDVDVATLPAANLGQQAMAASLSVTPANNITAGTYIGDVRYSGPSWTTSFGVTGAAVTSADASAGAAVTDAPTNGQKLVITDIVFSVGAAGLTVTFREETTNTVIFTVYCAANSLNRIPSLMKCKLATADKKLMVITSGAGDISVTAFYHSEA